jgi:hypothetical protein
MVLVFISSKISNENSKNGKLNIIESKNISEPKAFIFN